MIKNYKFYYKNKRIQYLTEKELKDCSTLYSKNYGIYSEKSPSHPGEAIKMGVDYYKKHYFKKNYYVALAYKNRTLVGHAIYVRKKVKRKYMTWIVQLVVKENERENGIAKKLMQSIWGFSNDYAWGLVTPNIITIKTLESTTFRKCDPKMIKKNLFEIKKASEDIDFVDTEKIKVNNAESVVDTKFYVKRELEPAKVYKDKWVLGDLSEGQEWLAFTFNRQPMDLVKYKKRAKEVIEFSEETLKDAYNRMRIKKHNWAKNHRSEVNYIIKTLNLDNNIRVLDFGCGVGRHSIEFARRNYNTVGVDFSERHIKNARRTRKKMKLKNLRLYKSDVRTFNSSKSFDLVLCLYDVVGSFPEHKDNLDIIRNAYKLLKEGGFFVLSVMNYELTNKLVPANQKVDVLNNPETIIKLTPSTNMMETGNIFNPKHLVIDTSTKLVYRKEQFPITKSNDLPAEYVIRDKRYTMNEIVALVSNEGFNILEKRYVQAGNFDKPLENTDIRAKEILIICQK